MTNHYRQHENIYRTTFINDHHQRKFHSVTPVTTRYHSSERIDIDSHQKYIIDKQSRTRHVSPAIFNAEIDKQQDTHSSICKKVPCRKNFYVKVYRNGVVSRGVWCLTCSMDILFTSAAQQFQMSVRFRRLFDEHGVEIFKTEDIIPGMEYYVSTGENFIDPFKGIKSHVDDSKHLNWTVDGVLLTIPIKKPRPQQERPDFPTGAILLNKQDIRMFLFQDRCTQIYKHEPQHETHDCRPHPKCLNQYDIPITPSLLDKYVQINRPIHQIEHPDCQKHHVCPNQLDQYPATDISTQTSVEPISIDEIIDLPKCYILMNQYDKEIISPTPIMESIDQYKYPTILNLGDPSIAVAQEEHPDQRKQSE